MLATVSNAGKVLDLFDSVHPEWGVTEVAVRLGMAKPNAHALLATLAETGLLQRTARSRYRLGWRLYALGNLLVRTTDYCAESRRALDALAMRFGEIASLAVLDLGQVVYVLVRHGSRSLHAALSQITFPAHSTATGKILLAYQPWEAVCTLLRGDDALPAPTSQTIISLERLKPELERVAAQGYALSVGECVDGFSSMAAPVRDETGATVAALGMIVPDYRFHKHEQTYLSGVLEAARVVSRNLGYVPRRAKDLHPPARPGQFSAMHVRSTI